MIRQFADSDHVVMAHFAAVDDAEVVIAAGRKRARGVTDAAVFTGWHVVRRFTAGADAMARSTVSYDAGVVEDSISKILSVMAHPTVF